MAITLAGMVQNTQNMCVAKANEQMLEKISKNLQIFVNFDQF